MDSVYVARIKKLYTQFIINWYKLTFAIPSSYYSIIFCDPKRCPYRLYQKYQGFVGKSLHVVHCLATCDVSNAKKNLLALMCSSFSREHPDPFLFCSWRSAHIGTAQKKQQWSICVTCEYHITLACFDPQSFSWHLNPYPPKKTIENPLPNLENVDILCLGEVKDVQIWLRFGTTSAI